MPETRGSGTNTEGRTVEDAGASLLIEAGAVLASSLELPTTMGQVAELTIPGLADLCVIDLRNDDGTIRDVAVAAGDAQIAQELERLRAAHPVDPNSTHPVARVIDSGAPELLSAMTGADLHAYAQGSEHERFMLARGYRSAIVAPLLARGRTLGALSVVRIGESERFDQDDLELICELARRAALAIDNARLYSNLRALEQRLEAILANLAEAITVVDEGGRTVFANQAAAELLGATGPSELTDLPPGTVMARFMVTDERGRELTLEEMPARRLLRGESAEPLLVRNVVRATGEERWLIVRSSAVRDPVSGRISYAVNVYENITEVKRQQLAESFIAEAIRVLASATDYRLTLPRLVRLAVPQLADMCAVELVDERGRLEPAIVYHGDPEVLALAEELSALHVPTLAERRVVSEVMRSGEPRLISRPEGAPPGERGADPATLLAAVGARSAIIAPLAAPTGTLGTITLASCESRRRFIQADLGLAARLGRRAGAAIASARLYGERTRIASILQNALLPESLPEIPGFELSALYRPAGESNEVGGDFYDVFPDGRDRWVLAIGDVCGKGPQAARVTALARNTLRVTAVLGQAPGEMLDTLHRALCEQFSGAAPCTVCLVALELASARPQLTVLLAGHPPPLLIGADGSVSTLGDAGTMLGMVEPVLTHARTYDLRTGETLLLYTDGASEAGHARGQRAEGGLIELSSRAVELSLQDLLSEIQGAALEQSDGVLRDDVALLALRSRGAG